jgi:PPK2 family polyphosphate:nucleotide phosphotransferase
VKKKETNLSVISTRAPEGLDKKETKKEVEKLKHSISELQNLLYAENKHSLLLIIQGLDASGKDGTVKNVFEMVNPMGCKVVSFKKPNFNEQKNDFLWRVHQNAPERGSIQIFNRSHYEDVTTQYVHKMINEKTLKERFTHINNFEKLLTDNGTIILKFYLHISKEEQLIRIKDRMNTPQKMWKYNERDLLERKYWKEYIHSYENVFVNCSENCKWHIIPSDQKWYKEYLVAKEVEKTLQDLKMKYPQLRKNNRYDL